MEVTVHSVFFNKEGTRIDSTPPLPMFPGYAAWYGNVYMEDLPKGLEVDTKRFGVTNGIIPNATLRLIYRTGGYALILEQQGVLLESLITSLVLWILAEKKPLMSKQY